MGQVPFTLGMDVCGVVDAAGEGAEEWIGRRVVAMTNQSFGGMAESALARVTSVFDAPPELDDVEAAAFTLPFHTGYLALHRRARLTAGETLLVVGGASAVGTAMIQLGTAAGARGDRDRRRAGEGASCARTLGASRDRPHGRRHLRSCDGPHRRPRRRGRASTSSAASSTETIWTCVAREGRYVPVGFNDDPESGLTGRPLRKVSMGNFSVLGVMLGYTDMPIEFRRFGVNTFPPEVGREVHARVARARRPPARSGRSSDGASRWHEVAASARRPRAPANDRAGPSSTFLAGSDRRTMPELLPDDVVTEACEKTGFDEFGPDDFREGLAVLCESINGEARLNELGELAIRGTVVEQPGEPAARRRLDPPPSRGCRRAHRGADSRDRHVPGRDDLPEPAPRSGCPQPRAPALGGGRQRSPPSAANFRSGPRVDAARSRQRHARRPQSGHEGDPPRRGRRPDRMHRDDEPGLQEPVVGGDRQRAVVQPLAARHRSTLGVRVPPARRCRSSRAAESRGRWTLKSPHHAIALDALTAVYPDVRLVLLHRDPIVLSASVCSLISTLSGTFTDADHTAYVAEHWTAMLEESVQRIDAFRAAHPEHPIVDVQYGDLVHDPLRTVEDLYVACGAVLDDTARGRDRCVCERPPEGQVRHPRVRPGGVRARPRRAGGAVRRVHRPLRRSGRIEQRHTLLAERADYGMCMPDAARAMTRRWISEVPSKSV